MRFFFRKGVSFVPVDSDLYLFGADFINDRGDITGPAVLPTGDVHQYLLLRCDEKEFEGCRESDKDGITPVMSAKMNREKIDGNYVSHIRQRLQKLKAQ
jgi:hypothetical protein